MSFMTETSRCTSPQPANLAALSKRPNRHETPSESPADSPRSNSHRRVRAFATSRGTTSSRTLAGGYVEVTAAATGAYAERLERELAAVQDQLSYWQEVRAEQIASGAATDHSKDTINVGDQIKYFGSWCIVTRVNPKSVSITDAYGHRGTVPYAHIREHRVGQSEASS